MSDPGGQPGARPSSVCFFAEGLCSDMTRFPFPGGRDPLPKRGGWGGERNPALRRVGVLLARPGQRACHLEPFGGEEPGRAGALSPQSGVCSGRGGLEFPPGARWPKRLGTGHDAPPARPLGGLRQVCAAGEQTPLRFAFHRSKVRDAAALPPRCLLSDAGDWQDLGPRFAAPRGGLVSSGGGCPEVYG